MNSNLHPVFDEILTGFAAALDKIYAQPKNCEVLYASSDRDDEEPCGHAGIAQCADCNIWLCKRCRFEEGAEILCENCLAERRRQELTLRCLICKRVSTEPFCESCTLKLESA
jgi:hypothetical protein